MVNGIINTLAAFLMSGATLSFSFTATDAGGAAVSMDGNIITSGECYRMETDQALVVSDGTVIGIYQKGADEIILQPVETGADIMANPFALLKDGNSANYEITSKGEDVKGLPEQVVLKARNGAVYTINIQKYSALSNPNAALFTLNPEDYPTAIVTDLR